MVREAEAALAMTRWAGFASLGETRRERLWYRMLEHPFVLISYISNEEAIEEVSIRWIKSIVQGVRRKKRGEKHEKNAT